MRSTASPSAPTDPQQKPNFSGTFSPENLLKIFGHSTFSLANAQRPQIMKDQEINSILFKLLMSRAPNSKQSKALPSPQQVIHLAQAVSRVLDADPICLQLTGDFVVVGDIHGNIDDMIRILEKYGYPPATRYLFLGDYVDRGNFSVEVVLVLYLLKLKFPDRVYLLRGNHESEQVSSMYGFKDECLQRLNKACYFKIVDSFKSLPVAATLNSKVFCVHGGISKRVFNVGDILKLTKTRNIPLRGVLADLLWSDPEPRIPMFMPSSRGSGMFFGVQPLVKFLDANKFDVLIRSHESCEGGFHYPFLKKGGCKRCLTIFSTCDYCGEGNKGAVAVVREGCDVVIDVFEALTPGELAKRRVTLPEWLLCSGGRRLKPVDIDLEDSAHPDDVLGCGDATKTVLDV